MNIVKKIGIADIGPFKKGTMLPILPGISFLYGKNTLAGGNANAVGKTLLATSINDTFYEPTVRQDKPKAGRRVVVFQKNKQEIKIVHEAGKSERVTIFVDGQDRTPRTASAAKKEAQKLWGLTDDEYLTYGFVDYATPHPLVKGTTAVRKSFFSSFFGLDRMDTEKKVFMKELAEVKKSKAAHAELEKAFNSVRSDMLTKERKLELETQLADLQTRLKVLKRKQEAANAAQTVKTFIEVAGPKLKQVASVTRSSKEIKRDLRGVEAAQEQQDLYRDYVRDLKRYKEATEGLDMSVSLESLKNYADKAKVAEHLIYEFSLYEAPKRPQKIEKPEGERDANEALIRKLQHEIKHAQKFSEGVCDTCGQSVKARPAKVINRELSAAQDLEDQWILYEKYRKDFEQFKKEDARHQEMVEQVEREKKILKKYTPMKALYDARKDLPPKPERVEKPEIVGNKQELLQELEITVFKETNEDMIEATKTYAPVEFDESKLETVQERIYKIRAQLDLHASVKARALEIRERLKDLNIQVKKQEALELIIQGYADKAMKKQAIEAISHYLMESVNRYASLVFENYSFEFVWGTQIQILVHRPEGTSDVRKLSGAESMLFTLILILSLLAFVPSSKRLSLLVLDEPYASFSQVTAELFTKLLPHINQVIPSILIVTPKSGFRVEGAHEFTAVKRKSGTQIVKGHPDGIAA